tara:strand:+ start:120 stop:866 length:747 start_codon:yes stop_codon:yes gene_type:complete
MANFRYKRVREKNYFFILVILLLLLTILLLAMGVIGFRYNIFDISFSLLVLTKYGIYSALVTVMLSLISFGYYLKSQNKLILVFSSLFSFLISSFIVVVFCGYIVSLKSYPFMNDISTNYDEIINFKVSKHSLPIGTSKLLQMYAGFNKPYSNLDSLYINKSNVEEVFNKSIDILESMNLNITYKNLDEGIIEATAVSFWYEFKDDLIVRIEKLISDDIKIDVRSASRVGKSDFGKNYERIKEFLSYF